MARPNPIPLSEDNVLRFVRGGFEGFQEWLSTHFKEKIIHFYRTNPKAYLQEKVESFEEGLRKQSRLTNGLEEGIIGLVKPSNQNPKYLTSQNLEDLKIFLDDFYPESFPGVIDLVRGFANKNTAIPKGEFNYFRDEVKKDLIDRYAVEGVEPHEAVYYALLHASDTIIIEQTPQACDGPQPV